MLQKILPIGFTYHETRCRKFEVNKIDGFMERIIHNEQLKAEKPQKWMASLLSCLLHDIEGKSVSSDFFESDGKKIPDIVRHIPLVDAGLILVMGQIETYGPMLIGQHTQCGCRHVNIVDVDLSNMTMPGFDFTATPMDEIVAHLQTGWRRVVDPSKAGQKELGWEHEVFDEFVFGIPTVGDALNNEKYFLASRVLDFQVRIVNDRLKHVRSSKTGFVMPNDMFEAYKAGFMFFADRGGLFANDRMIVRDTLNRLPQVNLAMQVTCENCQHDYNAGVNYQSFFPLVS
jgi:hypothetical protein